MSKILSRNFALLLGLTSATGIAFSTLPLSFDPIQGVVIIKSAQA